jgi:hypothetical protein
MNVNFLIKTKLKSVDSLMNYSSSQIERKKFVVSSKVQVL